DGDPPVSRMPAEAAPEALYHCCTPEQVEWALPQRGSQPVIPFTNPFKPPAGSTASFDALPRGYVTCLQDRAIKPAAQKVMYTRAGCDSVIEIDTDHSPWLSRTDELVAALDRAAGGVTSGSGSAAAGQMPFLPGDRMPLGSRASLMVSQKRR